MKYVLYGLIICRCVFALQDFGISAYHVNDTMWFDQAGKDTFGLNLIHGDWGRDTSRILPMLRAANNESLKVQLMNATSDTGFNPKCLEWYCRSFWTNWEVDSSNFSRYIGILDTTSGVQGNDSWKVQKDSCSAGTILTGPNRWTITRCDEWLDFDFVMKIDSLGDPAVKVCSLWINDETTPMFDSVITVGAFDSAGVFDTIHIPLSADNPWLSYGIYWYDNRTLWVDFIETKDRKVDDIRAGVYYYNILGILGTYDTMPALGQYYLLDEPDVGNFAANAYIMRFVNTYNWNKPAIQTVTPWGDSTTYEVYVDSVKPAIFLINYYPFKGEGSGYTPKDSGIVFQNQLDMLCKYLMKARALDVPRDSMDFWYACQAFGMYDT